MASLAESQPARRAAASDWRWLDGPRGTLALWGALVAACLALVALTPYTPYDPDDLMRLQQVRDLLGGQAWFDVTQYRMGPPDGAAMHWSRLVDAPLAGTMLLLRLVMPAVAAEYWATVIVPMLYLGAAIVLLRAILVALGFTPRQALLGVALAALFPLLAPAFAPLRIDHHAPQALAALTAALMLLRAPDRGSAVIAGLACATWLAISLEGLPMVALVAAIFGLRYLLAGERTLAWFLGALALASPLLSYATRPPSEFARWCDILLPAHWYTFAAGAAIAAVLPRLPRQATPGGRFAALLLLPLVCAPLLYALLGEACRAGPYAMIDPLLRTYGYDNIDEGLPLWRQPPHYLLPCLWTLLLVPAGLWAVRTAVPAARARWVQHALFAAGAGAYGVWLLREMVIAQLLIVPFALALLVHVMPRARALKGAVPRVLATFACAMLVTPAAASLAGKKADALVAAPAGPLVEVQPGIERMGACDFAALDALPKGGIFASFNSAPTIMAKTRHWVTMGGYHRNAEGLRQGILAAIGDEATAHRIVRASGATYLAACLRDDSWVIYAQGHPDSLAQALLLDRAPAWLEPVAGFEGTALRVYRVR